jgi:glycosyltransferase involved in cell wall biosynthesis
MIKYSIGITTFSKRFGMFQNLISQIRSFESAPILVAVNGEKDGSFNEAYRTDILRICSNYSFVFPIFFPETRGLSKLWNTLLSHSPTQNVLLLNDDLEVHSDDLFEKTSFAINHNDYSGLNLFNNSFSHFVCNRHLINEVGWFDERLLGFAEEDGDIVYSLLLNNKTYSNISVSGLTNIVSNIRHEEVRKGSINGGEHKYSAFNREFVYGQKYKQNSSSPVKGMFDFPMDRILPNTNALPYESFFWENKTKLYS